MKGDTRQHVLLVANRGSGEILYCEPLRDWFEQLLIDHTLFEAGAAGLGEMGVRPKVEAVEDAAGMVVGWGVTLSTDDHRVVFRYVPENQKGGGAFSCQRLPNGYTLVGENASGRLVEVDPAGRVVFSLMTRFESKNDHHHMRMARKLANGNYLVCHSGDNVVREYRPDGTTAWEQRTPSLAFAAVRLPNGNTLVSAIDRLIEYASDGQEVWSFAKDDVPGVTIQNMTGFHVLPNSNLVVGCYAAYTKEGQGTGMFEITRAKQLVWRYASPGLRDKNMMGVQKLVAADETPLR